MWNKIIYLLLWNKILMFTSFLNPEKFLHLVLYLPITLITIMFLVNVNMHKIDHLMFSKLYFLHSLFGRHVIVDQLLLNLFSFDCLHGTQVLS